MVLETKLANDNYGVKSMKVLEVPLFLKEICCIVVTFIWKVFFWFPWSVMM